MTASPTGLSAALLPTQRTLCGSEPKAFPLGKGTQSPFQLLRNRGAAQHWHFPGSHGLPLLGPVTAWSLAGVELCHGFVTLLLVFHVITSWTKEKNYVSQRTSRSEKEDTSSGCARSFSLSLAARERSGCAFQAMRLHQVGLSV